MKYGSADIKSKHLSNDTVKRIARDEYQNAKIANYFSYILILLGILLILLNVTDVVNFEIDVLGMKGKLLDASPGVFLVFIGLVFSFINRPKIKIR